jgi:DNA repair protein RecO (recombination protein O)
MASITTDAIVLHAIDYLESSRILRLITREAGVQSVLARGARTSRKRFGSALDLYAGGRAELQTKTGRDLHTLVSFEVTTSRVAIGTDMLRFTAAAAFSELVLRMVHDEGSTRVFDAVADTMSRIAEGPVAVVTSQTIAGLWRLAAEIGVAPALHDCASCHKPISTDRDVNFSHDAGGALCDNCGAIVRGGRRLPESARAAISAWLSDQPGPRLDRPTVQAHQRLLREFLVHHVTDARNLRAYNVWETGNWDEGTEIAPAEL